MSRARGVFDLRVWVAGADEYEVRALVTELQRRAGVVAPDGVVVRYVQLRDGSKTLAFDATMAPNRGRGK